MNNAMHIVAGMGTFCLLIFVAGCGDNNSNANPGTVENDSDSEIDVGEMSANGTVYTEELKSQCDETCAYLTGCNPTEFVDCDADCAEMAMVLNPIIIDSMGSCVKAQGCASLNPETCVEQGIRQIPDSASDPLLAAICDKTVECAGGITSGECLAELQTEDEILLFKMMNEKVIDCVANCLPGLTCSEMSTEGDTTFENCLTICDATIGDDDEEPTQSDCSDVEGNWTSTSVSCSGQALAMNGATVSQSIDADCHTEMLAVNGDCTITYTGEYERGDTGDSIIIRSECGSGCTEDACSTANANEIHFDVSLGFSDGDLIMDYNVTGDVINANMSPCGPDTLNTTVFSLN